MMYIDIGRIAESKGASRSVKGEVNLAALACPEFLPLKPAQVEATVTNVGCFLHVEGLVWVEYQTECVRCLSPLQLGMSLALNQDYLTEAQPELVAESENEFLPTLGEIIQLDPVVLETVVAAIPMKHLCREDCPGFCTRCGRNLKEENCGCAPDEGHPGLAALARLLPKKEV